jgi:hypothetical protein
MRKGDFGGSGWWAQQDSNLQTDYYERLANGNSSKSSRCLSICVLAVPVQFRRIGMISLLVTGQTTIAHAFRIAPCLANAASVPQLGVVRDVVPKGK